MKGDVAPVVTVGDLKITVLTLGEICDNPRNWFETENTCIANKTRRMPVICLHIAGPKISVLIDACDSSVYPILNKDAGGIRTVLKQAEIDPDTITHVILTHGHHDHFCGVLDHTTGKPNFPTARHVLSPNEWAGNTLTTAAQMADGSAANPHPLETLYQLGLLDLNLNGFSLPLNIVLIDAPGETKGHRIVQITSKGQVFFFLADLFHVQDEIDNPTLCPKWADAHALTQSRLRIACAIQKTRARFMCSHMAEVFSSDRLPHG